MMNHKSTIQQDNADLLHSCRMSKIAQKGKEIQKPIITGTSIFNQNNADIR